MKMPTILKRKKLHAATARRSRSLGLPEELDQMSEPNMKLSRALLIVLVLHVVAVAGIIAFNTIKTREAASPTPAATPALVLPDEPAPATEAAATLTQPALHSPSELSKMAAPPEIKLPAKPSVAAKPAPAAGVTDSGEIYTVVKGDNPVTIARHLHVSYDALLELNQITDPRKLQIGQKLRVPVATTAKAD